MSMRKMLSGLVLLVLTIALTQSVYAGSHGKKSLDEQMIQRIMKLNGNVVVKHEGEHGLGEQIIEVHLPEVRITNEQMEKIGQIQSLESFTLTSDIFSIKTAPNDLVDWLSQQDNLKKIKVHGFLVNDTGVKHLTGLKNLTSMSLYGAKITDATLANLRAMPQLERLEFGQRPLQRFYRHYFRGHMITDAGLANLQALPNLTSLSLYTTHVTDKGLDSLQGMTQLNELNLGHTRVSDAGLQKLAGLVHLKKLNLDATDITDNGLAVIGQMTQLNELSLNYTNVTDAAIAHIQNIDPIHKLNLQRTKVTDAGVAQLANLHHIEELDLGFTAVGDAGMAALAKSHTIDHLYLDATQVTDAGLASIDHLTSLVTLDVSNTGVTSAGVHQLKDLTNLQELILSGTGVDDSALTVVKNFPHLHTLNLANTQVTDKGMPLLEGTSILGLYLDGTKLTDAGLKHVGSLKGLIKLTMNSTAITSAGFKHLKGMKNMRILKFEEVASVDDKIAPVLAGMKQLQIIGATGVKGITDRSIKSWYKLPDLHTMELRGTSVGDKSARLLKSLDHMHCYDLAQSKVTHKGLAQLKHYANVHSLAIDGKQASKGGLENVKNGLAFFQELYMYGPDINDEFFARSKKTLNGLEELNLFGAGVTDKGFKHLHDVKSLKAVRIASTNISPEAIDAFRQALPNVTVMVAGETGWKFIKPWGSAHDVTTMP